MNNLYIRGNMPLYEYYCDICKTYKEIIQKIQDTVPTKCPNCSANNSLTKIISLSSFHLKGHGWHRDLYASSKKPHINNNKQ